jgi:putative spermidine/putrescine transport system substrate-binding protein
LTPNNDKGNNEMTNRKSRLMRACTRLLLGVSVTLPYAQGAAAMQPLKAIGKGEGALNVIAWEGYAEDQWVKPFEAATGCMVHAKYAGSSDEMVALMRSGGGNQYDVVSASGDATLRLIYGHDVQPINMALIPAWKNFIPQLKSPGFNTIHGVHYGVSYEWGPNALLYNTKVFPTAPTSWEVIYDPKYATKITVPDNPIQIADAALYLSKKEPSLGITNPYELTRKQMDAVVALLKQQRKLIKKYWALASDEIQLFTSGDAVVGAAWPYQTNTLQAAKVPVADRIPSEGATGWADTWMISAKAAHPNCAYMWINWVTTPRVQAEQAIYFGETPANSLACREMDAQQAGSCAQYHANAPAAYFDQIKFWTTPRTDCGNGKTDCLDYTVWQREWQAIKG